MPNIPLKWAAAATLLISSPAFAGTVFFDTFDTENGGATSLNHTGFANWNSTGAGFVDVVAMPDYGLTCAGGSGSCVDLDGSPGPGRITTKRNFTFNTGDLIRIDYDISGSQRGSDPDRYEVRFNFFQPTLLLDVGFNRGTGDRIAFPRSANSVALFDGISLASNDPFRTASLFFTAGSAGSFNLYFESLSSDGIGPILDNVRLSNTGVPEPASWAMMIAGFGLVGGAVRRRSGVKFGSAV